MQLEENIEYFKVKSWSAVATTSFKFEQDKCMLCHKSLQEPCMTCSHEKSNNPEK